jgi:fatty acid desaturase
MIENFETIRKSSILNSKGVKYTDFRATLKPNFAIVWFHVAMGYLALIATLSASIFVQMHYPTFFYLNIPLAAVLLGYEIAYIQLFIHEAAHFNVALDKKKNDWLANIFFGLMVGLDIQFYRVIHFDHHKHHGTTEDTEKTYFDALNWRFILEAVTGIRVLKVMMNRDEKVKNKHHINAEILARNKKMFFAGAILNLLFISTLAYLGYWQTALAWLGAMGIFFPFFASVRQLLEHRDDHASAEINYNETNHGIKTRMFGEGLLANTFGGAGFNRHLLHHWDPQISYTRLRDVELFLQDSDYQNEVEKNRSTYFSTFKKLFNR